MEAISKLVLAFILIVVGLALVSQIATSGQAITTLQYQTDTLNIGTARLDPGAINESKEYTALATYPFVGTWKNDYSECRVQTLVLKNESGFTWAAATDYVYTPTTNKISFVDSTNVQRGGNVTTLTYGYCSDTYLSQGWSRSIINLVPGLFAIALLGVGVGLFYSLAKDAEII